jgi:hypothetical protein
MTEITAIVAKAIEEIRASWPNCPVDVEADGAGGAYVVVREIPLSAPYAQNDTWIGFQITFQYPYADVYPHFMRPDLTRTDGKPLRPGLGGGAQFRGQPAIQVSRRSNKLNPVTDTANLKLLKVHKWLLSAE